MGPALVLVRQFLCTYPQVHRIRSQASMTLCQVGVRQTYRRGVAVRRAGLEPDKRAGPPGFRQSRGRVHLQLPQQDDVQDRLAPWLPVRGSWTGAPRTEGLLTRSSRFPGFQTVARKLSATVATAPPLLGHDKIAGSSHFIRKIGKCGECEAAFQQFQVRMTRRRVASPRFSMRTLCANSGLLPSDAAEEGRRIPAGREYAEKMAAWRTCRFDGDWPSHGETKMAGLRPLRRPRSNCPHCDQVLRLIAWHRFRGPGVPGDHVRPISPIYLSPTRWIEGAVCGGGSGFVQSHEGVDEKSQFKQFRCSARKIRNSFCGGGCGVTPVAAPRPLARRDGGPGLSKNSVAASSGL